MAVDPLGVVEVDPEGLVVVPEVVPDVPLVLPDVLPAEPVVDPDEVLPLPTFPAVDPEVVEPEAPVDVPLVGDVLVPADAPVVPVGETGTLVVTPALVPEADPLFADPPITPKPNSRAKVSKARAIKPPTIHQQGWHSAVSL